jgi:hypothetical protein
MATEWKTEDDLTQIGNGITLLVTKVTERNHALVRFEGKDEPSEEERAALQFANACLPFDPKEETLRYRATAKFLLVPISAVQHYKDFGFKLKMVPSPSREKPSRRK